MHEHRVELDEVLGEEESLVVVGEGGKIVEGQRGKVPGVEDEGSYVGEEGEGEEGGGLFGWWRRRGVLVRGKRERDGSATRDRKREKDALKSSPGSKARAHLRIHRSIPPRHQQRNHHSYNCKQSNPPPNQTRPPVSSLSSMNCDVEGLAVEGEERVEVSVG